MKNIKFLFVLITSVMSIQAQNTITEAKLFTTTDQAVGNITFTNTGDLVYSHHPFFSPENRVMIMDAKTKTSKPFPTKAWNTPRTTDDNFLSNVLGVRNDENGIVWMLDMAQRDNVTPKIVGWNTKTNELERIYYLPTSSVPKHSQPNDMVVDTKHGYFIIADEGIGNGGDGTHAAFIIVDMKTGKTRRLLEGTRTTLPENTPTVINGKHLAVNSKDLLVGNDGITADATFEYIYYGPLNGTKIYRIKTLDLVNEAFTDTELDRKIETYSEKPNNGGMSIDIAGNIYLTALETNSVAVVLAKDKSVKTMVKDVNMVWPDGVSYNHVDGYMYVSAAQVNKGAVFNDGNDLSTKPFYMFRFKPIVEGVSFR
ncbi:major royal jelly family protein [Ulvibacter litoralis]|uniref:Major royal jelly protein n=1 Tax=Ulvibacter litoralis TaxID=227084 RepID=A0A1G7FJ25_9FLAO|nr:major royal jelly family protein [Ulvibacter litoralis]GHC50910.1 periplasmic protein [Ulvibacter litoralis]SDE75893.1 Major royal jelly protein [Ulvibacter litoralis]